MSKGVLDDMLSDDEKKYFETGGEHELREEQSGQDVGEKTEPQERQEYSARADGANDRDYEAPEDSRRDEVEASHADESDQSSQAESKRDFKKAYDSERAKRQELKAQYEAEQKRLKEMEALIKEYNKQQKAQEEYYKQQQELQNVPDRDEDPIAYAEHQIKNLSNQVSKQQEYLQSKAQEDQRNNALNEFMGKYVDSAQKFSANNSDFAEAYKYITEQREQEYRASGYSAEEAKQILLEEELSLVAKAYKDGADPAERIYNLAKHRGFASQPQQTPKSSTGNKMDNLERGIKASKTLGTSGAMQNSPNLTLDSIDNMDFNEFDKFWEDFKRGRVHLS